MRSAIVGLFVFFFVFVGISNVSAQTYTDTEARTALSNAGISVNYPAPRTSLEGIRQSTIKAIITLKSASGVSIVVTGRSNKVTGKK